MKTANPAALPESVVATAIHWQIRLQADDVTEDLLHECHRWLQANPQHQLAWDRIQLLEQDFIDLNRHAPANVSHTILQQVHKKTLHRRQVLKGLAAVAVTAGMAGWWTTQHPDWLQSSGYATAKGERRRILLEDGSELWLNSASAIQINYTAEIREIFLQKGDVHIQTAPDPRPMHIRVQQGFFQPLGTRFLVRQLDNAAYLQVTEGSVAIYPNNASTVRAEAGSAWQITKTTVQPDQNVQFDPLAWMDGVLVVRQMRLADFLHELERHRKGRIYLAPSLVDKQVSGVFQLQDTDATLVSLAEALDIRLVYSGRFWTVLLSK